MNLLPQAIKNKQSSFPPTFFTCKDITEALGRWLGHKVLALHAQRPEFNTGHPRRSDWHDGMLVSMGRQSLVNPPGNTDKLQATEEHTSREQYGLPEDNT